MVSINIMAAPGQTLPDQDALHGDVGEGGGQGVGRHEPSTDAQPVGEVEQRIAGSAPFLIVQVTAGMLSLGSLAAMSSNGPRLTISSARYCAVL